jgi:hypothetical protein
MILLIDLYFEFKNFQQKHAERVTTVELKQKKFIIKSLFESLFVYSKKKVHEDI